MTRIPSPHPQAPGIPPRRAGNAARLLVIPDVNPSPPRKVEGDPPDRDFQAASAMASHTVAAAPAEASPPASELNPGIPASSPRAGESPTLASGDLKPTPVIPQLARKLNIAAATEQVRRVTQALPKRSAWGWQRTVLLVMGGALLAYGVTGNRPRGAASPGDDRDAVVEVSGTEEPDVPRMSRVPLRLDHVNSAPKTAESVNRPKDDEIFHVPKIGLERSGEMVEEAQPKPVAKENNSEFPVIGAPDGSSLSRRRADPLPDPRFLIPAVTQDGAEGFVRSPVGPETSPPWASPERSDPLPRETIAERDFPARRDIRADRGRAPDVDRAWGPYPQTDPATYRDPDYVIPSMANQRRETPR